MEHITSTPAAKGAGRAVHRRRLPQHDRAPSEPARLATALVRSTPGARTNRHSHTDGQTLYITDGLGLVGTRDGSVVRVGAGQTWLEPVTDEQYAGAVKYTS